MPISQYLKNQAESSVKLMLEQKKDQIEVSGLEKIFVVADKKQIQDRELLGIINFDGKNFFIIKNL